MKKLQAIKILKNRFTWVIVASVLTALGVAVPPETLNAAAQAIITIIEVAQ